MEKIFIILLFITVVSNIIGNCTFLKFFGVNLDTGVVEKKPNIYFSIFHLFVLGWCFYFIPLAVDNFYIKCSLLMFFGLFLIGNIVLFLYVLLLFNNDFYNFIYSYNKDIKNWNIKNINILYSLILFRSLLLFIVLIFV